MTNTIPKLNRLELVLLSDEYYEYKKYQPYANKGLYIFSSTDFILYDVRPTAAQKMEFIRRVVTDKIRINEVSEYGEGYFGDDAFEDHTRMGRDIISFKFLQVEKNEEHLAIPFIQEKECEGVEEFGYLSDGSILNVIETKRYMEVLLEKECIRDLEDIATTVYIPPSSSTGMFTGFNMHSFAREHFGRLETIKEVESKYRELAKIYHPDRGGEELMFKAIANTKQYLIDKIKHKTKCGL